MKNTKKIKNNHPENEYSVQDFINIKDVRGGLIFMNNGNVICIMEILPINFYQRQILEKNLITDSFKSFFRIAPDKLHFKIRSEKSDITKIISNIKKYNKDEKDPKVLAQINDYIKNSSNIQNSDAIRRRFYLIFEYEGMNGKKSNDINEIYRQMCEQKNHIKAVFSDMGNLVIDTDMNNADFLTGNILYRYFNPKSCYSEPFNNRYARIISDKERYNSSLPEHSKPKNISVSDIVGPRGIFLKKSPNYIIMDGEYHTFIALRDNGYPSNVYAGWINILGSGEGIDVDIYSKKLAHDTTVSSLEQFNRWNRVNQSDALNNASKFDEIGNTVRNIDYVTKSMRNADEDLFNVMIIITIRGSNIKDVMMRRNSIAKNIQSKSMYTEDSFLTAIEYFKMTMPFMYFSESLFLKNAHNFLTSSMASLYCFTAYEMFDESGFILGLNTENNTLAAINNFNTEKYANGNIVLFGKSGAGKTFTEQMIGYRMRMTGIRTFFILPAKGYEYYPGCQNIGGQYIKLAPASENCINIMQIRPECNIDTDVLSKDAVIEKNSLLSKKITSIIVFIQLLVGTDKLTTIERNKLNTSITKVYKEFGITDNNDSIWGDKANYLLKPMPILSDLVKAISRDPDLVRPHAALLPFTSGNCKNMDGQTNVSFDNKYIVFDVDEDNIGEELLPAFLYIAFDCVYDMAKQNTLNKDAIIMDEVWKMMINQECAKQVKKMIKLVRGYGACVLLATQDIEDFMGAQEEFGASVINNTEIKIFLSLNEKEINAVGKVMEFSAEDKKSLHSFKRGTGLVYANKDKVTVRFIASKKEIQTFTTDINLKQKLANVE